MLLLSVLVIAGCSSPSANLGASPRPGSAQASPVTQLGTCATVTSEGARVTEAQVVDGCTQNGQRVVLTTVRCRDGRTYLAYGTRFKGILGGVWHDVGPGHEAAAKRFASC